MLDPRIQLKKARQNAPNKCTAVKEEQEKLTRCDVFKNTAVSLLRLQKAVRNISREVVFKLGREE